MSCLYLVLNKFWRRGRLLLEKASCCRECAVADSPSAFALGRGKVCRDSVHLGKGLSGGKEPCQASHLPACRRDASCRAKLGLGLKSQFL